jgi:rhodanese-related sulfurtransferase
MNNNGNHHSVKLLGGMTLFALAAIGIIYALMGTPGRAGGWPPAAIARRQTPSPGQGQAQQTPPSRPAPPARPESERPQPKTVQPSELVHLLSGSSKPTIVSVSSRSVYESGHIPGALYHGPASSKDGLKDLKQWAETVPKTTSIVLYCGCCPVKESPDLRPALMALREMGFTNVKALWLEHGFEADWAAKGYPVEKGK